MKLERLGGQGKRRYSHGVRDYDTKSNEPTWNLHGEHKFQARVTCIHGIRARLIKNGTNKKIHEFIYPTLPILIYWIYRQQACSKQQGN